MAKTTFRIEAKEKFKQLADNLAQSGVKYKRTLKLDMWRALSILEAAILMEMQKKLRRRTGALQNSISHSKKIEEHALSVVGTIGPAGVVYAAIHEFGGKTRPHIIRPRNGKTLKFTRSAGAFMTLPKLKTNTTGASSGQFMTVSRLRTNKLEVFAKEVHHPGSNIPARPYIRPALLKTKDKILERFGLSISTSFKFEGSE